MIEELAQKIKSRLIEGLLESNDVDAPCLHSGKNTYSKRQIADEIERETDFGMKTLTNMFMLTLDLVSRGKLKSEERNNKIDEVLENE